MDVCAWVGLECSTTKQEAQVSLKKGGHLGYFLPLQLLCCKTLASFQGNNIYIPQLHYLVLQNLQVA